MIFVSRFVGLISSAILSWVESLNWLVVVL